MTVGFVITLSEIYFVYYFLPPNEFLRLFTPKMLEIAEGAVDALLDYPAGALIVVFKAYFPWIPAKPVAGAF